MEFMFKNCNVLFFLLMLLWWTSVLELLLDLTSTLPSILHWWLPHFIFQYSQIPGVITLFLFWKGGLEKTNVPIIMKKYKWNERFPDSNKVEWAYLIHEDAYYSSKKENIVGSFSQTYLIREPFFKNIPLTCLRISA